MLESVGGGQAKQPLSLFIRQFHDVGLADIGQNDARCLVLIVPKDRPPIDIDHHLSAK